MKRFLIIFLFASLLISGCTRYATITSEKLNDYPENYVTRIKLPVKIAGMLLYTGDTLYFDEAGGTYFPKSNYKLVGITKDGEEFSDGIFLGPILILHTTHQGKTLVQYMKSQQFAKISKKWKINPDSTAIWEDIYFDFDKKGGLVDFGNNQVYGNIVGNDNESIAIGEISQLTVDRLKIGEKRYSLGAKSGFGFTFKSSKSSIDIAQLKDKSSFQLGLICTKKYSQTMRLQAELNLHSYHFEKFYADTFVTTEMSVEQELAISYLELPILTKYQFPNFSNISPAIYFGPSFGYNINSSDKFDSTSIIRTDPEFYHNNSGDWKIANVRPFSAGLIVGGELAYNHNRMDFLLNVRYNFQLTNPLDTMLYYEANTRERPFTNENGLPENIIFNHLSISLGFRYAL